MTLFKVAALPAEEGDCLVLSYGPNKDELAHIVIDGGHTATQKHLKAYLAKLDVRELELVVVTHVDADHIEGMLGLVGVFGALTKPRDIWFNGYRHLVEDLQAFGPAQGETLTTALENLSWNVASEGRAIRLMNDDAPHQMPLLRHGLRVTILSPSQKKLRDMEPVWVSACRDAGLIPGAVANKSEILSGLQAMGADLKAIAATPTACDGAKANGTSIAMLVEYAGKRLVLGADAHPDILTASLRKIGDGSPVKVDLFKLPHHGSQGNVTRELLSAVQCHNYLFSTNGKRFHHPDQIAVARVVTSSEQSKRLWFNYRQPKTECWVDSGQQEKYHYDCCFPPSEGQPVIIDLMSRT